MVLSFELDLSQDRRFKGELGYGASSLIPPLVVLAYSSRKIVFWLLASVSQAFCVFCRWNWCFSWLFFAISQIDGRRYQCGCILRNCCSKTSGFFVLHDTESFCYQRLASAYSGFWGQRPASNNLFTGLTDLKCDISTRKDISNTITSKTASARELDGCGSRGGGTTSKGLHCGAVANSQGWCHARRKSHVCLSLVGRLCCCGKDRRNRCNAKMSFSLVKII